MLFFNCVKGVVLLWLDYSKNAQFHNYWIIVHVIRFITNRKYAYFVFTCTRSDITLIHWIKIDHDINDSGNCSSIKLSWPVDHYFIAVLYLVNYDIHLYFVFILYCFKLYIEKSQIMFDALTILLMIMLRISITLTIKQCHFP